MVKAAPNLARFIDQGLYTLPDAARLVGSKRDTIERWAFGYGRAGERYAPVIDTHVPVVDGRNALTFLELVELFTIREFRRARAPWRKIRATFEHMAREKHTRYPFALKDWFADPGGIYYEDSPDHLVEASGGGQIAMKRALMPYLLQLNFGVDGLAASWHPMGKDVPVVLDPTVAFGAPIVEGTGVETATLGGMAAAGESAESLAWWYELTVPQVDAALRYEGVRTKA